MSFSLQKANFWKRISAFMFDGVLLFVLALAFLIGFNAAFRVDAKIDKLEAYRTQYATEYGIDLDIKQEDYDKFTDEEKKAYDETYLKVNEAMSKDEAIMELNGNIITLVATSISLGLLLATATLYFVVPLCFKQGRTLGKKIFGLAVVRTNGVKLTNPILFARSLIGFYAIELMFPLILTALTLLGVLGAIGFITIGLFFILQIGVMLYTKKTNSCIHDLLTDSVVVDMASQQIFETQEERTEFDKAEAARKAAEKENGGAPIATGIFAPKFAFKPAPVQTAEEVKSVEETQQNASEDAPAETQSQNTDNA